MPDIQADDIEALELRVSNLTIELKKAKADLQAAKERAAGICVGDVVVSNGREFLVSKVSIWGYGKPSLEGSPRRKDGRWADVNRYIGDNWERPSDA